jgi:ribosome-associated protein
MKFNKLVTTVVAALEEIKAEDIKVIKVDQITALFDYIVVASATSNRHTPAQAKKVRAAVKAAGGQVCSIEGEQTGEWVLVDLGDVIVHIMLPVTREYYNLEALWENVPKAKVAKNSHPLDAG